MVYLVLGILTQIQKCRVIRTGELAKLRLILGWSQCFEVTSCTTGKSGKSLTCIRPRERFLKLPTMGELPFFLRKSTPTPASLTLGFPILPPKTTMRNSTTNASGYLCILANASGYLLYLLLLTWGTIGWSQQQATGQRYMVTSGHRLATLAGLEILRQGGNVVDAAVTTSLCLGVVEPYGSGLGGKLVMLYRDAASGQVHCIEALCPSPGNLDVEEFVKLTLAQRQYGYSAVGVPGLPAGLYRAHQCWGSLPWSRLVQPAIDLAARGFEMDAQLRTFFEPKVKYLRGDAEAARLYLVNQEAPAVGARLVNPDLADTLQRFADAGPSGFYQGATAARIVAAAQQAGSPLSLEDFSSYQPRVVCPLAMDYRGHCIYASPPPLTGGITVLLALEMLEAIPVHEQQQLAWIDAIGRALQCVYPRVRDGIADVSSARSAACRLLQPSSVKHLVRLAGQLQPDDPHVDPATERQAISASGVIGQAPRSISARDVRDESAATISAEPTGDDTDDASTSHLCIMDQQGNMVSLTQSLSFHFGAAVVAPGTGVLLNNSMSNFGTRKTSSVNYIAPRKRPRSTVTPIIIEKQSWPWACLGIPGGQRIPTTTLQLISQMIDFQLPLAEAVDRPRFHLRRPLTQAAAPNTVDLEEGLAQEVASDLQRTGWQVEPRLRDGKYFGGGNGISRTASGQLIGVADTRRTNFAAGD